MPVNVNRTVLVKTGDGGTIVLSDKDKLETESVVTVTCSSSRCGSRREGTPWSITWTDEEAQKNPDVLPEDYYRSIKLTVNPAQPQEVVVCSAQCGKDYLQYDYVPPKSPKELAAQMTAQSSDGLPSAEDLDIAVKEGLVPASDEGPLAHLPEGSH